MSNCVYYNQAIVLTCFYSFITCICMFEVGKHQSEANSLSLLIAAAVLNELFTYSKLGCKKLLQIHILSCYIKYALIHTTYVLNLK